MAEDTHPPAREAFTTPPYVAMYPRLAQAAMSCGYALAVHGSVARDFDLLAVPWTHYAEPAESVVEAVRAVCAGWIHTPEAKQDPGVKPHGRLVWTIHMGGPVNMKLPPAYIDLSVMPRLPPTDHTTTTGGDDE